MFSRGKSGNKNLALYPGFIEACLNLVELLGGLAEIEVPFAVTVTLATIPTEMGAYVEF
jgi:hypothetical protein